MAGNTAAGASGSNPVRPAPPNPPGGRGGACDEAGPQPPPSTPPKSLVSSTWLQTWWDPKGPMGILHKFNPVRLAYIRDEACRRFGRDPRSAQSFAGPQDLRRRLRRRRSVEPLARLGAPVTGLDPAPTNIEVARRHAERAGVRVDYRGETVEAVVARGERFDIVLAMEVVEHVADVQAFITACARA